MSTVQMSTGVVTSVDEDMVPYVKMKFANDRRALVRCGIEI